MNSQERAALQLSPGDRVELVGTDDRWTRLVPGERGTVVRVRDTRDGLGEISVSVDWDSGSCLTMLPGAGDDVRKVDADVQLGLPDGA